MAVPALNLSLVSVVLKGVADIVGCSVDLFMVHMDVGAMLQVDVLDHAYAGTMPAGKLGAHLCKEIAAATGLVIGEIGRCASEGGTVTVRVQAIENDELSVELGV